MCVPLKYSVLYPLFLLTYRHRSENWSIFYARLLTKMGQPNCCDVYVRDASPTEKIGVVRSCAIAQTSILMPVRRVEQALCPNCCHYVDFRSSFCPLERSMSVIVRGLRDTSFILNPTIAVVKAPPTPRITWPVHHKSSIDNAPKPAGKGRTQDSSTEAGGGCGGEMVVVSCCGGSCCGASAPPPAATRAAAAAQREPFFTPTPSTAPTIAAR